MVSEKHDKAWFEERLAKSPHLFIVTRRRDRAKNLMLRMAVEPKRSESKSIEIVDSVDPQAPMKYLNDVIAQYANLLWKYRDDNPKKVHASEAQRRATLMRVEDALASLAYKILVCLTPYPDKPSPVHKQAGRFLEGSFGLIREHLHFSQMRTTLWEGFGGHRNVADYLDWYSCHWSGHGFNSEAYNRSLLDPTVVPQLTDWAHMAMEKNKRPFSKHAPKYPLTCHSYGDVDVLGIVDTSPYYQRGAPIGEFLEEAAIEGLLTILTLLLIVDDGIQRDDLDAALRCRGRRQLACRMMLCRMALCGFFDYSVTAEELEELDQVCPMLGGTTIGLLRVAETRDEETRAITPARRARPGNLQFFGHPVQDYLGDTSEMDTATEPSLSNITTVGPEGWVKNSTVYIYDGCIFGEAGTSGNWKLVSRPVLPRHRAFRNPNVSFRSSKFDHLKNLHPMHQLLMRQGDNAGFQADHLRRCWNKRNDLTIGSRAYESALMYTSSTDAENNALCYVWIQQAMLLFPNSASESYTSQWSQLLEGLGARNSQVDRLTRFACNNTLISTALALDGTDPLSFEGMAAVNQSVETRGSDKSLNPATTSGAASTLSPGQGQKPCPSVTMQSGGKRKLADLKGAMKRVTDIPLELKWQRLGRQTSAISTNLSEGSPGVLENENSQNLQTEEDCSERALPAKVLLLSLPAKPPTGVAEVPAPDSAAPEAPGVFGELSDSSPFTPESANITEVLHLLSSGSPQAPSLPRTISSEGSPQTLSSTASSPPPLISLTSSEDEAPISGDSARQDSW